MTNVTLIAPKGTDYPGGAERVLRCIRRAAENRGCEIREVTNSDLTTPQLNYGACPVKQPGTVPAPLMHRLKKSDLIIAAGYSALDLVRHLDLEHQAVLVPFDTIRSFDPGQRQYWQSVVSAIPGRRRLATSEFFRHQLTSIERAPPTTLTYTLPVAQFKSTSTTRRSCSRRHERSFIFAPTRLSPRKRVEDLLRLAVVLKPLGTDVVVSGGLKTPGYEAYKNELSALNTSLGEAVVLRDSPMSEQEVWKHYREASAVVSTSSLEGFGIFALEAASCSTITFATDSIGIREIQSYLPESVRVVPDLPTLKSELRAFLADDDSRLGAGARVSRDWADYQRRTIPFVSRCENYLANELARMES